MLEVRKVFTFRDKNEDSDWSEETDIGSDKVPS